MFLCYFKSNHQIYHIQIATIFNNLHISDFNSYRSSFI